MSESSTVDCEFLVDNQLCRSIVEDEEGRAARERSCSQTLKNMCCYLCGCRESCEISCNYLDKSGVSQSADQKTLNIEQETRECQERIARLAVLLADGKIGEQSYVAATKALENRLDVLQKAKGNPNVILSSSKAAERLEEASTGRPTFLWYLVPLFFGILGGIVGYVGTRDEDKDMAGGLLLFGAVWSIILYVVYWIALSSLIFHAR
jgi:hypothetical protein